MDAIRHIGKNSPGVDSQRALQELWKRLDATEYFWNGLPQTHDFRYIPYLYRAKQYLKEKEWSKACYEIQDVIKYGMRKDNEKAANALIMFNLKKVLEEVVEDVFAPEKGCANVR